ncbi:MAG: histidine phosphatase family protein [Thermomicrobiales bacterium]
MLDPLPHVKHPIDSGTTTLFLVRHGRTDSNVRGLLHGKTDVPLDNHGVIQADCIAERMVGEDRIDVLISSPLQRALVTARAIGARLGLEPEVMPELVEMDFGRFEGVALERLVEEHPEIALQLDDVDGADFGWPEGETRRGFHDRVYAAFLAILAEHHAHRVLVVAHGGVIGSFMARVHAHPEEDWSRFHVENCSFTHMAITERHTTVHAFNDVAHLAELAAVPDRLSE